MGSISKYILVPIIIIIVVTQNNCYFVEYKIEEHEKRRGEGLRERRRGEGLRERRREGSRGGGGGGLRERSKLRVI